MTRKIEPTDGTRQNDEVGNTHVSPSLHVTNEQICDSMPEKANAPDMVTVESGQDAPVELLTDSQMEQEGNGTDEAPVDKVGTPRLKQATERDEETSKVRDPNTCERCKGRNGWEYMVGVNPTGGGARDG